VNISGRTAITGMSELKPMIDNQGRSTLELLAEAAGKAIGMQG